MNKQEQMFEAIQGFLAECDVGPLSWSNYVEFLHLVRSGAKVESIKFLRTVTCRELVPAVNSSAMLAGNEFYDMLVSLNHPLISPTKRLGLKRAKDVADVVAATTF